MDLSDYRKQIDAIDDQLIDLIQQRMDVAAGIADYKLAHDLPVLDASRERQKLRDICSKARPEMQNYLRVLYSSMFEISRAYQNRRIGRTTDLSSQIAEALEQTPNQFPRQASVAVCGVEGAYAQIAAEKLFRFPDLTYCRSFEAVFEAVANGQCRYGVIPIENSTAGSVDQIYDLMDNYHFSIVRSTRLKVDHNLLAKPGAKLADIREIVSHEQAILQSEAFLKRLGPDVKVTAVANTAMAAQMVAQSNRTDLAALSSRSCMDLYGLQCLQSCVQDQSNNYTRFLCICKDLEIYPGADRASIMVTIDHKPGSLYKLLSRFYALDINMTKLESRPIPDRDFEFLFYFDLEASVYSDEFTQLISELSANMESFTYLGSYSEVI